MALSYLERKKKQLETAPFLSEKSKLIRIADKGCNILDIAHYPLNWDHERKFQYLDFAKLIVEKISGVNPALETWFYKVYENASNDLLKAKKLSDS
jgi:guanosine-3',5'-bis(diphosphate) 3'-pyrophosphohydrolase